MKLKTLRFWSTLLATSWAAGIGLRIITEYINYNGNFYYTPHIFDMFFDWGGLFVLGLLAITFSVTEFYVERRKMLYV